MAGRTVKKSQIIDLADRIRDRSRPEHNRLFSGLYALFQEQSRAMTTDVAGLLDHLLMTIVTDIEFKIRAKIAADLARRTCVPPRLLDFLARDDIRVAHEILRYNSCLSDAQLKDIAEGASTGHRVAIAGRAGLSAAVTEVLIDLGEQQVLYALLSNIEAAIDERGVRKLVDLTRSDGRLAKLVLGRPELSAEHAHTMFWWVSSSLRDIILQKFDFDLDAIDRAMHRATHEAFRERRENPFPPAKPDGGKPAGPEEIEDLTNLFRTLDGQRLVDRLAHLMSIRTETAERILNDRSGEALAVCCKSLNANRQQFVRIFLVLDYSWFGEIRSTGHLQRVTYLYDTLSTDKARRTLNFWDLQDGHAEAA